MPLTLSTAKKKIEALNGSGKPEEPLEKWGGRRIASKKQQLEVWQAMVSWFAGDHSTEVHNKLIWQPAGALGHLLPQPPAFQPGDDWRVRSCQSEHYKQRYRISLSTIIEEWLNEKHIPAEELKRPKWLKQAIKEAADMVLLSDDEWGPVLEYHYEYYKHNPNCGEVLESWTFLYSTYRIHVKRYRDGRLTKNKNREEDISSPNWDPPSRRPLVETEISPVELLKMVNDSID